MKDWAKANYKEPQREKEELHQELEKIQEEIGNMDNTAESQAKEKEIHWKSYRNIR